MEAQIVEHGARKSGSRTSRSRRRKGAYEYAAENEEDFTYKSVVKGGCNMNVLVCKYCSVSIGARSDRIKEHLSCKRHMKLKSQAMERGLLQKLSFMNGRSNLHNNTPLPLTLGQSEDGDISITPSGCNQKTDVGKADDDEKSSRNSGESNDSSEDLGTGANEKASESQKFEYATPATTDTILDLSGFSNKQVGDKRNQRKSSKIPSAPSSNNSHYYLKWGTHSEIFRDAFGLYQMNDIFTDVTLACEGKSINCHKVVLAACSKYFFRLLKENPCAHPIIILKDTCFVDLESLVQFMYQGEVVVKKSGIKSFLKSAEDLDICGLVKPRPTVSAEVKTITDERSSSQVVDLSRTGSMEKGKSSEKGSRKGVQMNYSTWKSNSSAGKSSIGRSPQASGTSSFHQYSNFNFGEINSHDTTSKDVGLEQLAHQNTNQSPVTSEESFQQSTGVFGSRKRKLNSMIDFTQPTSSNKILWSLNPNQSQVRCRGEARNNISSNSSDHSIIDVGWENFTPQLRSNDLERNKSPCESSFQDAPGFEVSRPICEEEACQSLNERDLSVGQNNDTVFSLEKLRDSENMDASTDTDLNE